MFYLLSRGEPTPANLTHFQALHLALHLIPILLQIIKPPKIIFMKLDERLISAHHQLSPVHLEKQVLLKLTDALHLATFAVTLWKKEI